MVIHKGWARKKFQALFVWQSCLFLWVSYYCVRTWHNTTLVENSADMKIHFFQSFNRFSSMLTNWGKTLIRSPNVVYLREEQLRGVTTEPILSQSATPTLRTNYFYKYFWPWKPQSYYCFFLCAHGRICCLWRWFV